MSDHKRIILVGPAASGKTYMKHIMKNRGFKADVSYTTRPPRAGEIDGVDYRFITPADFRRRKEQGAFYECAQHGDYWYGTGMREWNSADVFIMETHGVSCITPEDRQNCFVMYVNAPTFTRLQRMHDRKWDEETVKHRMKMDREKFKDFENYDVEIISDRLREGWIDKDIQWKEV